MNLAWQQQVLGSSVGWLSSWQQQELLASALSRWWLQPCMPTPPRYTGPLEYLTMWMCLFLSQAVLERLQHLQAQAPDWTRLRGIRVQLSAAQAIHPHVLDVLQRMGSAPNAAPERMGSAPNAGGAHPEASEQSLSFSDAPVLPLLQSASPKPQARSLRP